MTFKVVIVDHGTSNRIIVAAHLHGAGIEARSCGTIGEAAARAAREKIAAVIAGPSALFDPDFKGQLRKLRAAGVAGVIAVGLDNTAAQRRRAIQLGVDDVLCAPLDADFLRASLRKMARHQAQVEDLFPNGKTDPMMGFAESDGGALPLRQGHIHIISKDKALCAPVERFSQARVSLAPGDHGLRGQETPDVILIDSRSAHDGIPTQALPRIMAELRAQATTRTTMQLVLLDPGQEAVGALALDLGADDVIVGEVSLDEIAHRSKRLLRRCHRLEGFRAQLRNGLRMAVTDPLTGLANRRLVLPRLVSLSQSHDLLAVLALDIDHFKRVNDRHGHGVGDALLVSFAKRLGQFCTPNDLIARIGGEEFLIAKPAKSHGDVTRAASELCDLVRRHGFQVSSVARSLAITASIGAVACGCPLHNQAQAQQVLDLADKALYASKSAGRDRATLSQTAA